MLAVQRAKDLDGAIEDGLKAGINAALVLSSPVFQSRSPQIASLTINSRLPAISPFREFPDAGGLMAYGPNTKEFFRHSAAYIVRIIEGAKAGDLPIELPAKFELVINLRTAKALGLTVPQSLLLRADEMIQ